MHPQVGEGDPGRGELTPGTATEAARLRGPSAAQGLRGQMGEAAHRLGSIAAFVVHSYEILESCLSDQGRRFLFWKTDLGPCSEGCITIT